MNRCAIGTITPLVAKTSLELRFISIENKGLVQCFNCILRHFLVCDLRHGPSLEHDVLEVIRTLVVPLILHIEDNAFAVLFIGPGEAVGVVVEAVLQLPCFQLAGGEVGVTRMMGGIAVLIEVAGIVGTNDDVKSVVGALCVLLRGGAGVVGDAVPGTWHEVAAIAQGLQGDISN